MIFTPNKWSPYNETYVILSPLLLLMWTHHEYKFYRIEFESKNPINKPQFYNHNFIPGYILFTCILLLDTPALINLEVLKALKVINLTPDKNVLCLI